MNAQKTVLVFGATGNQGGAVINALEAEGHRLKAFTRNVQSAAAQQLAQRDIELIEGDLWDAQALKVVMQGVDAVFAMTTPYESSVEVEIQQGFAIAEAAKASAVPHLVFSSVASADRATGIPHFDSKYQVEKRIVELGIPYTFIAPVFFMENHLAPWTLPALKEGTLSMAMPGERKLQQVAVADIGRFAALMINLADKAFGLRVDLAGDELTGEETAAVLSAAIGKTIRYQGFDAQYLRTDTPDLYQMFKWFDEVGYCADIRALADDYPQVQLTSLQQWAAQVDWRILD